MFKVAIIGKKLAPEKGLLISLPILIGNTNFSFFMGGGKHKPGIFSSIFLIVKIMASPS